MTNGPHQPSSTTCRTSRKSYMTRLSCKWGRTPIHHPRYLQNLAAIIFTQLERKLDHDAGHDAASTFHGLARTKEKIDFISAHRRSKETALNALGYFVLDVSRQLFVTKPEGRQRLMSECCVVRRLISCCWEQCLRRPLPYLLR